MRPGRPACRVFACQWLVDASLGDEWYPLKSKIVVQTSTDEVGNETVLFHVDRRYPNRWREPPYYAAIKALAAHGLRLGANGRPAFFTEVRVGDRCFAVLLDREVETDQDSRGVVMLGADGECRYIHCDSAEDAERVMEGNRAVFAAIKANPELRRRLEAVRDEVRANPQLRAQLEQSLAQLDSDPALRRRLMLDQPQ